MAFDKTIALLGQQEDNHWKVGDTLRGEFRGYRLGNGKPDWAALASALSAAGAEHTLTTMKAYYRVAAAFPENDRIDGVSFAAHQAALTMGDANQARSVIQTVQLGTGGKATREAVLSEVRRVKGRTTNQTSSAVEAWRMVRAGVDKLLDLEAGELDALLTLADGKYAGEAATLARDLGKVSTKVTASLTKAEKVLAARKAKKAQSRAAKAPMTAKAPKASAPAAAKPAPRVGRLGQNRGKA